MKITCTKENLRRALNLSTKIISSTTTLPILNNILLKAAAGQLQISSTNLEIAIKTWVGGQIDESGEITVPARTINDFINNVMEEKITLQTKGSDLNIKTKQTESVLKGLPAEEFPLIPEVTGKRTLVMDSKILGSALSQVSFATAFSETQPELAGVLFSFEGKELKLAATDRYRLAEKTIALTEDVTPAERIIVPNRAVGELIRILAEAPKNVDVSLAENQVLFRTANTEFISRIIEAQYPDYRQIIPQDFLTQVTVKTQDFLTSLKLSGLFAQDNNNVELEISKKQGGIIIRSASQKSGSNIAEVRGEITGEDNKILFNYKYILDCLNHLESDKVLLKTINANSAAMLLPSEGKDYLYLVMPIKT